jgi:hypothetical protein
LIAWKGSGQIYCPDILRKLRGKLVEAKSIGTRLRYREHKMVSFCIQTIIVSWIWIMIWHISPVLRWIKMKQKRDSWCHECHNPNILRNPLSSLVITSGSALPSSKWTLLRFWSLEKVSNKAPVLHSDEK